MHSCVRLPKLTEPIRPELAATFQRVAEILSKPGTAARQLARPLYAVKTKDSHFRVDNVAHALLHLRNPAFARNLRSRQSRKAPRRSGTARSLQSVRALYSGAARDGGTDPRWPWPPRRRLVR